MQNASHGLTIHAPLGLTNDAAVEFGLASAQKKGPHHTRPTGQNGVAALGVVALQMAVLAAVRFIAVAGISVQKAEVMLEHIMCRLPSGDALHLPVIGAVDRLRPALLTALMPVQGLLPLIRLEKRREAARSGAMPEPAP